MPVCEVNELRGSWLLCQLMPFLRFPLRLNRLPKYLPPTSHPEEKSHSRVRANKLQTLPPKEEKQRKD